MKALKRLSPSERRALICLLVSGSRDDAAIRYGRSKRTLDAHLRNAYRKLEVSSVIDAARVVGWLKVPPA